MPSRAGGAVRCGNRGCLETVASGPALARDLAELPPGELPEEVRQRLGAARRRRQSIPSLLRDLYGTGPLGKRRRARELLEGVAERLAWGASLALAAYDPQTMVLGGYLFQDHPELVRAFERCLSRFVMDWKRRQLCIVVAQLTAEDRALNGAAEACQHYWANPAMTRTRPEV